MAVGVEIFCLIVIFVVLAMWGVGMRRIHVNHRKFVKELKQDQQRRIAEWVSTVENRRRLIEEQLKPAAERTYIIQEEPWP